MHNLLVALCALGPVTVQPVRSPRLAEMKRIVWLLESCPRPDADVEHLGRTTELKFSEVARYSTKWIRKAVRAYMASVAKADITTWWQKDIKLFELNRYLFNVPAGTLATTPGLFQTSVNYLNPWVIDRSGQPRFDHFNNGGGVNNGCPDTLREFDYCARHFARRAAPSQDPEKKHGSPRRASADSETCK